MKVAIVDDEPAARRMLRESCAREADIEIIGEYGDGRTALRELTASPPDLLVLDIQMDGLTGLQVARALPQEKLPLIVFVTAYDQYAVEAFELNATDYLLKPLDDARLQAALARARRLLGTQGSAQRVAALAALIEQLDQRLGSSAPPARLLGELNGRLHMLDVAAIELVEADRNYVVLACGRERYHARSTLAQAETALAGQPMLRISRSCLVNARHLVEISRTPRGDFILVTRGGATVTSSEGHRDKVREYLENFRLGAPPPG